MATLSHPPQPTVHQTASPSNTLEQPSTHSRSSLSERSYPGAVTAAAVAVAAIPAPPAQARRHPRPGRDRLGQDSERHRHRLGARDPRPALQRYPLETLPPPQLDARLRALQPGPEPPAQECLEPVPVVQRQPGQRCRYPSCFGEPPASPALHANRPQPTYLPSSLPSRQTRCTKHPRACCA
ncbi:hypothetical protein BGZ61DRAFT_463390 [Ilyonectria robusta]|uniref:uncharacterized protein n=1 Tax=Ilyonectria robusta TaxID=1079257 RepID=UPI001E8D0E51|nr:uncharacterized protein BGZ61DRAFT_463390 [Ilyonectria robusta]KAH8662791.1 hypothetical protein BGZ61DRAFT_463390 [Ilyonectria robusta]